MMWNGFEGMGWGWIGFGVVHMLLFWVLVILGIIALMRALSGPQGDGKRTHALDIHALDILKARYAKGEITREQFEQMKRDIGESP
jgi:putative membrane protein